MSERTRAGIDYHDNTYQISRREYVQELRNIIEQGPPHPEQDWALIWVLSGPEVRFDDPPARGIYNQSNFRFQTGVRISKEVAALRTGQRVETLRKDDLVAHAPPVYVNGRDKDNQYLRELVGEGRINELFQFPDAKVVVAPDLHIEHSGDQFERFPKELIPRDGKLIAVTDLYHAPRVRRYFEKYPLKSPQERVVYPAISGSLSVRDALEEARKFFPYQESGIL